MFCAKNVLTSALLSVSVASANVAEQGAAIERSAILTAITAGADYSAGVLLQSDGRGRTEYDIISGRWHDYEVHWHTAQTLLGLLSAYEVTGEPRYLAAAIRAGDWWVGTEYQPPHPFAGLVAAEHGDKLGPLINMTTITDGTNAIFELSRVTGNDKYAETATRSGEWLLEHAYIPDEALFYNIFDPRDGSVWTRQSLHHPGVGPDEIKITEVARPNSEGYLFADMCIFTSEKRFCDVFLAVADRNIERQHPNGLWMDFEPNDLRQGKLHPRFNVWLAEAQMVAYDLSGDRKYFESALATARAMAAVQKSDGAIYYRNYVDGRTDPIDVTGSAVAFSGLLWLRLQGAGADEFDQNIQQSVRWLLKNQFAADHSDPNLRGAFLNTRTKRENGETALYQRDIGTSFALRFLSEYVQTLEAQGDPAP